MWILLGCVEFLERVLKIYDKILGTSGKIDI